MNIKKLFLIISLIFAASTADSFAQLTKIWEVPHGTDYPIEAISPNAKLVYARPHLIDLTNGNIITSVELPNNFILDNSGKRYFISNYQKKTLKVYDRYTKEFIQDLVYHQIMNKTITAPDDSTVFVANGQYLEFWNIYTNQLTDSFKLPDLNASEMYYGYVLNEIPSFTFDGRYFAFRVDIYSTIGKPQSKYTIFMVYDRKSKEIVFKVITSKYTYVYSFMNTTNQMAFGEVIKLEGDDRPYSYIRIFDLDNREIVRNMKLGNEEDNIRAIVIRNDDKFILYRISSNNETRFFDFKHNKISEYTVLVASPIFADDSIIVNINMQGYSLDWTAVGVNELPNADTIIYPNPTTNTINLNIEPKYFNGKWQLSDLTGQILLKGEISNTPNFQLDISNLTPATYFLRISNGREFKVEKVVKW